MDEHSGFVSMSSLSHFSSAKIKLDELFQTFLQNEGQEKLLNMYLEASRYQVDDSQLFGDRDKMDSDRANGLSTSPGPPKSALYKKSPKKRTQSEMANSAASSSSSNSPADELSRMSLSPGQNNASASNASPGSTVNNKVVVDVTPGGTSLSAINEEDTTGDQHVMRRKTTFDRIPIFHVPGRKSTHISHVSEDDKLSKRLTEIEAFFKPFPGGIPVEKFVHVTKRLCGIPSFFNLPLCRRINERFGDPDAGIPAPRTVGKAGRQPSGVKIKLKTFLKFWQQEIEPFDRVERFFRIIKKHESEYIVKDDFVPFLQELLHFHPGLDFLEAHEEFQRKYALTVITRIFYRVNTSRTGKISLREVRKSNLFHACMHVDEETDINKVLDYFSYEHFYVIYCKFFELDMDKDSKLTKHDLLKYGDHALSEAIVDRYVRFIDRHRFVFLIHINVINVAFFKSVPGSSRTAKLVASTTHIRTIPLLPMITTTATTQRTPITATTAMACHTRISSSSCSRKRTKQRSVPCHTGSSAVISMTMGICHRRKCVSFTAIRFIGSRRLVRRASISKTCSVRC